MVSRKVATADKGKVVLTAFGVRILMKKLDRLDQGPFCYTSEKTQEEVHKELYMLIKRDIDIRYYPYSIGFRKRSILFYINLVTYAKDNNMDKFIEELNTYPFVLFPTEESMKELEIVKKIEEQLIEVKYKKKKKEKKKELISLIKECKKN